MQKRHHPPHIYLNNTVYFLTARIYQNKPYLRTDFNKGLLYAYLKATLQQYGYILYAWVILDNHYHLEFKSKNANDLSKILNTVHGNVSYQMNVLENKRGRKVFQNYWDYCIRDEKDFFIHFNYIHYNPIKHGYVQKMVKYHSSSYKYWEQKKGNEWNMSTFEQYPVINFGTADDDCFDLK